MILDHADKNLCDLCNLWFIQNLRGRLSMALDKTLRNLNDCGCCDGVDVQTPARVYNRPGLGALVYRFGDHEQFRQTLIARLSSSGQPALRGLTTREEDDVSIALLDSWAVVADVLTFYQERIINESYLRTATERLSLLELARLIGYELSPGVAANTYLAFTIEDTQGVPGGAAVSQARPPAVVIDIGAKVQSVPGPGEKAQIFETVEKIEARAEWNAIKPRLTERHPVRYNMDRILLDGLSTGLRPGDGLLLMSDSFTQPVFRLVSEVIPENEESRTKVLLQTINRKLGSFDAEVTDETGTFADIIVTDAVSISEELMLNFGPIKSEDFYAKAKMDRFVPQDVKSNLDALQKPPPSVTVFRSRAAIFGHHNTLAYGFSSVFLSHAEGVDSTNIYLDIVYPGIVKDSYVALKDESNAISYKVESVNEVSKSDIIMTLSAKVSRLTLDENTNFDKFTVHDTTVFAESEELPMARYPLNEPVSGSEIELDEWIDDLFAGQKIIVCGEQDEDDKRGVYVCELVEISEAEIDHKKDDRFITRIKLVTSLKNSYVRKTVSIHANVAAATHGESVREVLGSGDATKSYQSFILKQPPLTYISSSTPSGTETTLEVRVNDLLWHEVPSFFGRKPEERIYTTRADDEGKTTVMFGDGITGTRLPTGQENVKAEYRKGIGVQGLLKSGQLSQLMTRPLNVNGVTNPIASSDAADGESISDVRRNAPLTVMTLDRAVSLQDYEDFARAFAGIDKALATWSWNGLRRAVFVTVAGANGAEVKDDSVLYSNLLKAMQKYGDPNVHIQIKTYGHQLFRVNAGIVVGIEHEQEKVRSAVEINMRESFSFYSREFGQPVILSEVIAIIQNIPGVDAVDVDKLYYFDNDESFNYRLDAAVPISGEKETFAAELLTLDSCSLDLEVKS